ncbi:MAG TPA: CHRD domain-containing protein, partial [Burkholderiales bacterium]|nr:CHRD domain-containing protein [Burkholderiales bacterium]
TQAHIHIAQRSVNGGIVLWMCRTTQTAPAGTAPCPGLRSGTVSGTWTAADVTPQPTQGIAPLELSEVIAMIRARRAYANVHTVQSAGGEIRGQLPRNARHGHGHDD